MLVPQSFRVLSALPDRTYLPSGEKEIDRIKLLWPTNVLRHFSEVEVGGLVDFADIDSEEEGKKKITSKKKKRQRLYFLINLIFTPLPTGERFGEGDISTKSCGLFYRI